MGVRRSADQADHIVTKATHGLGGFGGIHGDAVVLEVEDFSHG